VNPVVTIRYSINIDNEGVIDELGIGTFSSFFETTYGTSKDEIFPRWNGMTDNTDMIPFWNLMGDFWINPFIFWNIIDHNIGVLGSKGPSSKN